MRKLWICIVLISAVSYAREMIVSELAPGARELTEPYFSGNSSAIPMSITQPVYKQTPQRDLFTRVYAPAAPVPGKKYPCAIFFFGGGWLNGSLLQFGSHCEYLVSKGFIAMTPQYRVEEVDGTTPREAAEDAISCVRWVREHAEELNIDPDRIVVGGGSAGGHLAAATATLTEIYATNDNLSVSCRPNLLALFNPVVDASSNALLSVYYDKIADYWQEFSPTHNIQSNMPPTVIFHGVEDSAVPVWTVQDFAPKVEATGAVCDLYLYPGKDHGFFNEGDGENPYFFDTMYRMGQFLEEQGYIPTNGFSGGVIYDEAFYIDGSVRTENLTLNGSRVGSSTNGTGVGDGQYTWTVSQTSGFSTKFVLPGTAAVGDGGMYYSALSGADSYATVNFHDFSEYDSFTLTAVANALDCSPLRMGFGVNTNGSFASETGDALYIQTQGGSVLNSLVDVSLIVCHNGTSTVLETFAGADRLTSNNDTMTFVFDRRNNSVTGSFKDGYTGIVSTFSAHPLSFVPSLSCVKYEIRNEGGYGNSNFPRWESTCLEAVARQTPEEIPDTAAPRYCGFYRGTAMDPGLYTFTDLADPVGTATRIGTLSFPTGEWENPAFSGTNYYMFGRGTGYGGAGLHQYDGDAALPLLSGTYTFSDWHGLGFCNQVFYGLYHGAGQSGQGLYLFADPSDPFGTGIRLFPTQTFPSNIWTDVAFDGQRYLFVRNNSDGGISGIYRYDPDTDQMALLSGTEAYETDWDGLGVFDSDIAPMRNKKLYVLLFGGQSNGEGWGYQRYLSETNHPLAIPRDDVDLFYEIAGSGTLPEDTLLPLQSGTGKIDVKLGGHYPELTTSPVNRFGPELSFASTVRDLITIPDSKVALIKFAFSGSSLYDPADWLPDGTASRSADGALYQVFQKAVWKGISALRNKYPFYQIDIFGMGWVQGESDALETQGANYQTNLTKFIQDVRLTFNTNLTFVLSKLSPNQISGTTDTNKLVQWPLVTEAQDAVAAAVPKVGATSTTGSMYETSLGFDEGQYHYTSAALLQIGEDLAVELMAVSGLDSDQDGLPDAWERKYAAPAAFSPEADYDHDGFSDLDEYRLGTDPANPFDYFSFSMNSAWIGRWSAKSGIEYRFMYSTNLITWKEIGLPVLLRGAEHETSVDLSACATNRQGFFRLLVQ